MESLPVIWEFCQFDLQRELLDCYGGFDICRKHSTRCNRAILRETILPLGALAFRCKPSDEAQPRKRRLDRPPHLTIDAFSLSILPAQRTDTIFAHLGDDKSPHTLYAHADMIDIILRYGV